MNSLKEDEDIINFCYDLLFPIPENDWLKDNYTDGVSKCCAIGHIKRLVSSNINDYSFENCLSVPGDLGNEASFLRISTKQFMTKKHKLGYDISYVNDTKTGPYPQNTPKKRVIALLEDMKEERE